MSEAPRTRTTNWRPLTLTFPTFSFIGDAKGAVLEAIVFVLVLVRPRARDEVAQEPLSCCS
jgi:hypothetical protein